MDIQPKTTLDSFPESGWYSFIWTNRSKDKLTYGNVDLSACLIGSIRRHLVVTEGVWDSYRKEDTYELKSIHSVTKVSVFCDEIQKHLPANHPDKIISGESDKGFLKGTWYKNKASGWFYLCEKIAGSSFYYKEFINPEHSSLHIVTLGFAATVPLSSFDPDILADYSIIHKVRPPKPAVIKNPPSERSDWFATPIIEEDLFEDITPPATPINNPEGRLIEVDSTTKIPEKWAIKVVGSSNNYPELANWRKKYSAIKSDGWSASGYIDHLGIWSKNVVGSLAVISIPYFIKKIYNPLKQKDKDKENVCEENVCDEYYDTDLLVGDFGKRGGPGDPGDMSDLEFQEVFELKNTPTYNIDPLINISVDKKKVNKTIFVEPIKNITI